MVRVIVDAVEVVEAVVVGVLVAGLLLYGVALAAMWVKQGLDRRHKK